MKNPVYKNKCQNISFPFLSNLYQIETCRFTVEYIFPGHSFSTKKIHHHSFFEIHFVVDGKISYKIENESITLKKNQFLIVPPKTKHVIKETKGDISRYSIAVSFNESCTETVMKSFSKSPYIKGDFDKEVGVLLHSVASDNKKNDGRKKFLKGIRIYNILNSLPIDIYDFSGEIAEEDDIDVRLAQAKQFVQDNVNFNLTCTHVARHCYLSEKQLTRIFKKSEGITLAQYITRVRTKKAEHLLADSTLSVGEVSDIMGFSSEFYFNSFFKRNSGMAPGEYRKTLR